MELLTISEAAALLRIHRKTMYKLVKSGEIYAVRLGGQWRIPREEIENKIWKMQKDTKKGCY